jgi:hypothetical protein
MRRRRRADSDSEAIVVTLDDGVQLRCTIAAVGRETEPRWAIVDSKANQYVGPAVDADHSPDAVKRAISAWWATHPRPVGATAS